MQGFKINNADEKCNDIDNKKDPLLAHLLSCMVVHTRFSIRMRSSAKL
jgi:hypothetical protein